MVIRNQFCFMRRVMSMRKHFAEKNKTARTINSNAGRIDRYGKGLHDKKQLVYSVSAVNSKIIEGKFGQGKKKKWNRGYKREDLVKVIVYAYQQPVIIESVDILQPWYKEGKVLLTQGYEAIALRNGYRLRYIVQVYVFHKVPDKEHKLNELIQYIRRNPKRDYSGWIHHANVYGGISKRFIKQLPLNFDL